MSVWQLLLIGIRSLVNFSKDRSPLDLPVYLNSFRGEPAISEFDWPFTPSHSSSPSFSTEVGAVLQLVLPNLQPDHG